jgi:hypothetical protein
MPTHLDATRGHDHGEKAMRTYYDKQVFGNITASIYRFG